MADIEKVKFRSNRGVIHTVDKVRAEKAEKVGEGFMFVDGELPEKAKKAKTKKATKTK